MRLRRCCPTTHCKNRNRIPRLAEKTQDRAIYDNLKSCTLSDAGHADSARCLELLKGYTSFFRDSHIWLLPNETATIGPVAATHSPAVRVNLSKFRKALKTTTDPQEGIWKDDTYEVGILKIAPGEYTGVILQSTSPSWQPGQVKFRLYTGGRCDYLIRDHSVQKEKYELHEGNILYFAGLRAVFVKTVPGPAPSPAAVTEKTDELNGFYIRRLSPRTTLMKLSNFSYPFVESIKNMIEKNKDLLAQSEFLIIDIRGNGGGTDDAYQVLLPYLVTGPVRHMNNEFLSTPSFIKGLKEYKATLKKPEQQEMITGIDKKVGLLEASPGQFIRMEPAPVIIDSLQPVLKSPQGIVMLADKKVGSAAENLLLTAKQSKKVKVMGTPSFGVLDYANAYFFDFGCSNYKLLLPTYRSLRLPAYPIDNIGIQPDIYLDDSVADWVLYAQHFLEN